MDYGFSSADLASPNRRQNNQIGDVLRLAGNLIRAIDAMKRCADDREGSWCCIHIHASLLERNNAVDRANN
jgi:hypothetical protein